jgi:DNA polymerase III epsilon subunit-like protein
MNLIFDTETTGLPAKGQYDNPRHPDTPRVIELAALLIDKDAVIHGHINTLIVPEGFEIPERAAAVHGITTAQAYEEGQDYELVIHSFRELAKQAEVIVAHNLVYDLLCLSGDFFRFYGKLPNFDRLQHYCTKEATTGICRIPAPWGRGFKWPSLDEAYQHLFNAPVVGAHRAMTDVRHTTRIFFKTFYGRDIPLPDSPA